MSDLGDQDDRHVEPLPDRGTAVFKKRPVPVEAVRMSEPFTVETPEGTMEGEAGDWLITGVEGEQYPCDDEVFRETYDPVGDRAESMMRESVPSGACVECGREVTLLDGLRCQRCELRPEGGMTRGASDDDLLDLTENPMEGVLGDWAEAYLGNRAAAQHIAHAMRGLRYRADTLADDDSDDRTTLVVGGEADV